MPLSSESRSTALRLRQRVEDTAARLAWENPDLDDEALTALLHRSVLSAVCSQMAAARGMPSPAESPARQTAGDNGESNGRPPAGFLPPADAAGSPRLLGEVYEQLLPLRVRRDGSGASVEKNRATQKHCGAFYTPDYVVRFIVQRSLGPLLRGKTPQQATQLRILDPACGAGWFLLAACQWLLDWHLRWYVADGPRKHARAIVRAGGGRWRLRRGLRREVLTGCIYGVDLDPLAADVTRWSLALALCDGGPRRAAAPVDLRENIRCGDALLGPDFRGRREQPEGSALDWKAAFPRVLAAGGFDAVLGNPPYGAALDRPRRDHLAARFRAGTADTAALFVLRARELTRRGGRNGFIVPKALTYASNWSRVRALLLDEMTELVDAGKAFPGVKLEQAIYLLTRGRRSCTYRTARHDGRRLLSRTGVRKEQCGEFGFWLHGVSREELDVASGLARHEARLGDLATNCRGALLQSWIRKHGDGLRAVGGKQVQPFGVCGQKGRLDADADVPPQARVQPGSVLVQNIVAHVLRPVDHIKLIAAVAAEDEAADLVILDTVNQLTPRSHYAGDYLAALLASRLIRWYVYRFIFARAVRTMHFDGPVTARIPVPALDFTHRAARRRHDRLADVAQHLARLQRALASADGPKQPALRRQYAQRMAELDTLVYEAYGLDAEAQRVVEAGSA